MSTIKTNIIEPLGTAITISGAALFTSGNAVLGGLTATNQINANGGMNVSNGMSVTGNISIRQSGDGAIQLFDQNTTSTPTQIGCSGNDLVLRTANTSRVRITSSGVGVSSVWVPSFANILWARVASGTLGNAALSDAVTAPGSSTETWRMILFVPGFNYDSGDGVLITDQYDVPGGSSLVFSNLNSYLYSINGVPISGRSAGTNHWKSRACMLFYRVN